MPHPKDYYVQFALENLQRSSRTANGVIDTSSSPEKAGLVAKLSTTVAAQTANSNYTDVISRLHEAKDIKFQNPEAAWAWIEDVAVDINRGLLAQGAPLLRAHDVPKYPCYAAAKDLEADRKEFAQDFVNGLKRLDTLSGPQKVKYAQRMAGWVEHRTNMTGHFFNDGCGKTASALAAFVCMRADTDLPIYVSRTDYFLHEPKQPRVLGTPQDQDPDLQRFLTYYQSLFARTADMRISTTQGGNALSLPRKADSEQ